MEGFWGQPPVLTPQQINGFYADTAIDRQMERPPIATPQEIQAIIAGEHPASAASSDMVEAIETVGPSIPLVGSVVDLEKSHRIYQAAKRVEAEQGTVDDWRLLKEFLDEQKAKESQGLIATTLDILRRLPAFAGEIALTGGAFSAGKAAVQKTIEGGLKKLAGKGAERAALTAANRGITGAATKVATTAAGASVQAAAMAPLHTATQTVQNMTPALTVDEKDQLAGVLEGSGDDFLPALAKGYGESFVEMFSERAGGAVAPIAEKIGIPGLKAAIMQRWLKLNPSKSVQDFVEKVSSATAWHGVIGEMGEERLGEALRPALGIEEEYTPPTRRQLLAEALAFSVPGAARRGLELATARRRRADGEPASERTTLPAAGAPAVPPGPDSAREGLPPSGSATDAEPADQPSPDLTMEEIDTELERRGLLSDTERSEYLARREQQQTEGQAFGTELAQERRQRAEEGARYTGPATEPLVRPGELESVAQPKGTNVRYIGTSERHDYSSTQFNLPDYLAHRVKREARKIPEADLAEDGREEQPHLTVKYGLHTEDVDEVRSALAGVAPFKVRLGKTSLFENDQHDVVKVDIDEAGPLRELNAAIAGALEHTDTQDDYKPHVTLAYVKPGRGKKYVGKSPLTGTQFTVDRVVFSDKAGRQHEILLGQERAKPRENMPKNIPAKTPAKVGESAGQGWDFETRFPPPMPEAFEQGILQDDPDTFDDEANASIHEEMFNDLGAQLADIGAIEEGLAKGLDPVSGKPIRGDKRRPQLEKELANLRQSYAAGLQSYESAYGAEAREAFEKFLRGDVAEQTAGVSIEGETKRSDVDQAIHSALHAFEGAASPKSAGGKGSAGFIIAPGGKASPGKPDDFKPRAGPDFPPPPGLDVSERPKEEQGAIERIENRLRPISMPELYKLAKAILGDAPALRKLRSRLGYFKYTQGETGGGKIVIGRNAAEDPVLLAKVLAHEMGHMIDWLPDHIIRGRGNILGRIASLRNFLKHWLASHPMGKGELTNKDRARLRREAEKLSKGPMGVMEIDEEIVKTTPITPQDILNIWNSVVDQRDVNAELWRFVARMSDAEKKSIVKDALRGVVPAELQRFAKEVREKTGRKIRTRTKSTPTEEQIAEKYRELILAEIRKRQLLDRDIITDELKRLTLWWTPFEPAKVPGWYEKYRFSAPELYAEALSVFLVSPGDVAERAPMFYRGFLNYLSRKPEVMDEYLTLQDLLNGTPAELAEARRADIREGFAEGEEVMRARATERKAAQKSIIETISQLFYDRGAMVLKAEKRAKGPRNDRAAAFALEELALRDNRSHVMLSRIEREIAQPLLAAGVSFDDMGEYLVLRRIIHERQQIANPYGHVPATAKEQLANLRELIGPTRFEVLEEKMAIFDAIVFDAAEEAVKVGAYSRETFETVIKPNKGNYATFAVVDYLDESIPAAIRQQVGTFKDVANPFVATIMKTISLNRLIELQIAKRAVLVDLFQKHLPSEIKWYRWFPDRREPKSGPGKGIVTLLNDGRPDYAEVDEYAAGAFLLHDIGLLAKLGRWVQSGTYKIFHPLYVTLSPSWQVFNLPRDIKRTYKNMAIARGETPSQREGFVGPPRAKDTKRITFGEVLREYFKASGAAWRRGGKHYDPQIEQMLADRALDIPFASYDYQPDEDAYDRLLERHGLGDAKKPRGKLLRLLNGIFNGIERVGVWTESLPKVAAWNMLGDRGIQGQQRAYIVRNYVGTPNTKRKGLATNLSNGIAMYSNVILQGLRADAEIATRPKSAAGYWTRSLIMDFGPKMAMRAALAGAFGATIAAIFKLIPDYELANYLIIPLGTTTDDESGETKAVYLRLPHDDTNRILAVTMWLISRGEDVGKIISGFAGQLPFSNLSPPINIPLRWIDFARGHNPYDSFRRRDVISRDAWEAGGWYAAREMIQWNLDQFGVVSNTLDWVIGHPGDQSARGAIEKIVGSVPGLSRVLRFSNRGLSEDDWADVEMEDAEAARLRLSLSDPVRRLVKERYRLNRIGVERLELTDVERRQVLNLFYTKAYLPLTRELAHARQSGNKARSAELVDELDRLAAQFADELQAVGRNR